MELGTIQETAADKYADQDDQNFNPNLNANKNQQEAQKASKTIRAGEAIAKMQEIAK